MKRRICKLSAGAWDTFEKKSWKSSLNNQWKERFERHHIRSYYMPTMAVCVFLFHRAQKKNKTWWKECFCTHKHNLLYLFTIHPVFCVWHYSRNQQQLVEPTSKSTWLINPDFLPCPVLYVVVVITIIQQLQALSVKAWCSFPSIRLQRLRAFPPYRVWPFFFFCVWKCLWA